MAANSSKRLRAGEAEEAVAPSEELEQSAGRVRGSSLADALRQADRAVLVQICGGRKLDATPRHAQHAAARMERIRS